MIKRHIFFVTFMAVLVLLFFIVNKKEMDNIRIYADIENISSYVSLLDDSFIYMNMDDNKVTYYRQYLKDSQIIEIGKINDFLLNTKSTVLIGNVLYFYATIMQNDKFINVLYGIDLLNNTLNSYSNEYISQPGIFVSSYGRNIISLKFANNNSGTIDTYFDIYNVDSMDTKRANKNSLDNINLVGTILLNYCAYDSNGDNLIQTVYNHVENVKNGDKLLLFLTELDEENGYRHIRGSSYFGKFIYDELNQNFYRQRNSEEDKSLAIGLQELAALVEHTEDNSLKLKLERLENLKKKDEPINKNIFEVKRDPAFEKYKK